MCDAAWICNRSGSNLGTPCLSTGETTTRRRMRGAPDEGRLSWFRPVDLQHLLERDVRALAGRGGSLGLVDLRYAGQHLDVGLAQLLARGPSELDADKAEVPNGVGELLFLLLRPSLAEESA